MKTIDQACNAPEGTFKKFLAKEHAKLRREERQRIKRIKESRKNKTP